MVIQSIGREIMKNLKEVVGNNLTELRKQKGLTQIELADKFNYSDKSISKWEKGDTLPDLETLNELCKFYGVSLDYLVSDGKKGDKKQYVVSRHRYNPNAIAITAILASILWFIATITYVYLMIQNKINYWMVFLWAIPVTCIFLWIANKKYFENKIFTLILSTIFAWSLIVSVFLQCYFYVGQSIWPLFIVGIPLQVTIVLWATLKRVR